MNVYAFKIELKKPDVGSATNRLAAILNEYAYHPKSEDTTMEEPMTLNLTKWYTPKELTILLRALRGRIEAYMATDAKRLDKDMKPAEKKDKLKEMARKHIANLKEVHKLIPKVVGEFRTRLDDYMEGLKGEDKKKLTDVAWVQQPAEYVKKWQDYIVDEKELEKLSNPLEEVLKIEDKETPKHQENQKGWNAAEFTKFKDLEDEMESIQKYVVGLTDKLDEKEFPLPPKPEGWTPQQHVDLGEKSSSDRLAGDPNLKELKPVGSKEEIMRSLNEYLEKAKEQHEKLMADADAKEKEAHKKAIEKIDETKKDADESKNIKFLPSKNNPERISSVVVHELEWFKKLHSMYHNLLWIHNKFEVRPIEELHQNILVKEKEYKKDAAVEYGAVDTLHGVTIKAMKKMINDVDHFGGVGIASKSAYASASVALKSSKNFHAEASFYLYKYEEYMKDNKLRRAETVVEAAKPEELAKEFEGVFHKDPAMRQLEKGMTDAQKLKWAEEELDDLYGYFKKEYMHPSTNLRNNAEREKKTPQELIKETVPDLMKAFVERWLEVEKESTEEPVKVPTKYKGLDEKLKVMQEKGVLPDFSETKKIVNEPGVPSRKELVDYIERNWMAAKTPKEILRELFDKNHHPTVQKALKKLKDLEEVHGGGGSSSGGREKIPKHIVSAVQEITEAELAKFLDGDESAKSYLNRLFKAVAHGIKLRSESNDDMLDKGVILDSFAAVLYALISNLKRVSIGFPVGKSRGPGKPYSPAGNPEHSNFPEKKEEKKAFTGYQLIESGDKRHPAGPMKYIDPITKKPNYPQHLPGKRDDLKKMPHLQILTEPGPLRARPSGVHITIPAGERGYEKAMKIDRKIRDLHTMLEGMLGKVDSIYPPGFLNDLEILHADMGKGIHKPTDEESKKEEQKQREEDKKNQDLKPSENPDTSFRPIKHDIGKKAFGNSIPGYMAYKIASKFIDDGYEPLPELDSILL